MAGEAKGQVGGLDMSENGRARLAKESRAWRCAGGCGGRTNEEVLRESAEEWKLMEESGRARKEESIPEELRLEYRDDLERGPPTPRVVAGPSGSSDGAGERVSAGSVPAAKSPLMAGPVANLLARSKPPPSPLHATASSSSSSSSPLATSSTPSVPPAPASSLRPTTTTTRTPIPTTPNIIPPTPAPTTAALVPPRAHRTSTAQEAGVPPWLDKAIFGLIVTLAVMVIKKMIL